MQKIGFCDRYGLTEAVLNGTKTMTRRLIPPKVVEYALNVYHQDYYSAALDYLNDKECLEGWLIVEKKSRYKLGEVVAVAQAYKDVFSDNDLAIFDDGLEIKLSKGWSNKLFVRPDLMIFLPTRMVMCLAVSVLLMNEAGWSVLKVCMIIPTDTTIKKLLSSATSTTTQNC